MSEIAELERRITAALERIGRGMDNLSLRGPDPAPDADLVAERDAARAEALAATARAVECEAEVDRLTAELDATGLDLQRLRKTAVQLRETLAALRERQAAGLADPVLLNAAMAAEIEALQQERRAERRELEAILAALQPLVAEVQDA